MGSSNFSLQITRIGEQYKVITIASPVGQPESQFLPVFSEPYQLEAISLALEATDFQPTIWAGDDALYFFQTLKDLQLATDHGFAPDLYKRVGSNLFKALFSSSSLVEALHTVINESSREKPARVELRFSEESVDLASYPWELLYEPNRNFLFSAPKAGLVRCITCNLPSPELLESEKLRLLLVSARPIDPLLQRLPGTEKATISAAQADSLRDDSLQVEILPRAGRQKSTWDLLNEWLINHKGDNAPHIFHFDGHGGYGKLCQCGILNRAVTEQCRYCECPLEHEAQGYLAFEKMDSGTDWISANKLSNLLSGSGLRLAVLSACKSAVMNGNSVFNGMAPALILAGIPAVVAMQFSIDTDTTEKFIRAFYQSLSNGDTLVAAVNQARAGLSLDPTAWYRPVLYLRTDEKNPDGRLLSGYREKIQSPSSYVKLTASEGINQREAVTKFASKIMPEFQRNIKNIMVIEAPPHTGKSTALRKFLLVCEDQASKQEIAFASYDLDIMAPTTIATNIIINLSFNAKQNPRLSKFASSWREMAQSLTSIATGLKKGVQKGDQETEWNNLAIDLYEVLENISKDALIVLIFDNFQKIIDSPGGIWMKNYFLQFVKNQQLQHRSQNFVIVIAGDYGLKEMEDWPVVEFLDVINDVDIEDIQTLAKDYGILALNEDLAEIYIKQAKGDMETLKHFLWSYSQSLKLGTV